MDVFLKPSGRIGPATFRNAALILIAIGAVFSLLPWLRPDMAMLSFVSMILIYPWIVIWVKRFHDAGKPGSRFLAVLVPWLITGVAANRLIVPRFVPNPPPVDPHFVMASMAAQLAANALPATIIGSIISIAFALVVNEELKSDPAENAYGPPPPR